MKKVVRQETSKKKAEKEMNKRQAVTMNQNFYFSYFRQCLQTCHNGCKQFKQFVCIYVAKIFDCGPYR